MAGAWEYSPFDQPPDEKSSFDWMSMIPMLLGTAASIRNPQAGNQLIGIGDYLRRDRMASLSAERERRMAEAQRRRQELQDQQNMAGVNALRQQFPQYEIPDMPFDAARQLVNIQEDQRHRTLAERRREAQIQATRGASEASTRYRTGGVSAADQLRSLQKWMAELDIESQSKFQPDLKYLQEATQREAQAREMMSSVPQLDPAQQGPELLDPDTRKEIASGYGRGEITSIPAALERRGRQPNIIPEGEPYLAEQLGQVSKQQQAITSQMRDYIIQRHAQGLPISFGQAQVAGFAGTTPGSLDQDTLAALAAGVSPWEVPYMDPKLRQGAASTAVQAASTAAARRGAEGERAKTAPLLERASGVERIQTQGAVDRAARLARQELELPKYYEGPFATPDGRIVPGSIETPRQRATGSPKITDKDLQSAEDLSKTRGLLIQIDELSKQVVTAQTGYDATVQRGVRFGQTHVPFLQHPLVKAYNASRDGFNGQFARTFGGERGVLTEQDVQRVMRLTPDYTDTQETRNLKMRLLQEVQNRSETALRRKMLGLPPETEAAMRTDLGKFIQETVDRVGSPDDTAGKSTKPKPKSGWDVLFGDK